MDEHDIHPLQHLPEDCVIQILEHLSFPLHRYARFSTLNKSEVKFGRMIKLLYGYFPLSSLSHRKVYLLYRNVSFKVPYCRDHLGKYMNTLENNKTDCFQLLPFTSNILRFTIESNLWFQSQSFTSDQCAYVLSRLQGLKKLVIHHHIGLSDDVIEHLRSLAPCLSHLELIGTNVTINGLADALLDDTVLIGLTTLILNESVNEAKANETADSLAEALENRPQITHVELSNHPCIDNTVVRSLLKNKYIKKLNIASAKISDHAFQYLFENTTLTSLNVAGCSSLADACVNYLLESKSLTELDVSNCYIDKDFGKFLISSTSNLRRLCIKGALSPPFSLTIPTDDILQAIVPEEKQDRFEELTFNYNKTLNDAFLVHLTSNHAISLNKLNLLCCNLNDQSCKVLTDLCLPNLQWLDISMNSLTDAAIEAIQNNISNVPLLCHLAIHHNNITKVGAKTLASFSTITDLDLSYNKIEDEGAAALLVAPQFIKLSLSSCNIKESVFDGLNLAQNECLQILIISYNSLTAKAVSSVLSLPNITILDLSANWITDECIEPVMQHPSLTSLFLKRNRLTRKGTTTLLTKANRITNLNVD